jgi:serine/threonine protein kinase
MTPGEVLTIGAQKVTVGSLLVQGDMCDLYHGSITGSPKESPNKTLTIWERLKEAEGGSKNLPCIIKVARHPMDNDLVDNEAKTLNELFPSAHKEEKFLRYIPQFYGTAFHGKNLFTVLQHFKEAVSLEAVLRAYPKGIDYRDLAWMVKRAFAGLGFAHFNGFVHGAVIPPHILVQPLKHGGKIVDWAYAIKSKSHRSIKAVSIDWKAYYAPEVFAKQFPTAATDVYMVAKCAVALLGGNLETNEMPPTVPKEIQDFFGKCLVAAPSKRPQVIWDLHDELEAILLKLVGKPAYRPFVMP